MNFFHPFIYMNRKKIGLCTFILVVISFITVYGWYNFTYKLSLRLENQIDLFNAGENGYHTFRIPALLAIPNSSVILAFCEGRVNNSSDYGNIDMVMKRSVDGGQTWSNLIILWDNFHLAVQNPCPVYDLSTKVIFLHMVVDRKTHWVINSTDFGLTWSSPLKLTIGRSDWGFAGPAPGHAIQLQSGRLLIPGMYNTKDSNTNESIWGSFLVYSDDHGATWQLGHDFTLGTNEMLCTQLANGSIISILRPNRASDNNSTNILVSISNDEGKSSSNRSVHPQLISPICQASILQLPVEIFGNRERILFSNPANSEKRLDFTFKVSEDGGITFNISRLVYRGPCAYSDLAYSSEGKIYCIFERGVQRYHEHITFFRTDLTWIYE